MSGERKFFWFISLSTVNTLYLYKMENIQGSSRQIHKKFQLEIVHGLVQPLLHKKSKSELIVQPGRRPNIHATRLQGKHFSSSMYPWRGVCRACRYKKRKNGKQTKKKTCNYCAKCEIFLCKVCFEGFHTKSKVWKLLTETRIFLVFLRIFQC